MLSAEPIGCAAERHELPSSLIWVNSQRSPTSRSPAIHAASSHVPRELPQPMMECHDPSPQACQTDIG